MDIPKDGTGPRIALILEPLADEIEWPIRVRRALKALLRSYKLANRLFVSPELLEQDPSWQEIDAEELVDA